MEVQVSTLGGRDAELETSTWAVFILKNFLNVYKVPDFRDTEVNRTLSLASVNLQWRHEPASTCNILLKFTFYTRKILLKMQILQHSVA